MLFCYCLLCCHIIAYNVTVSWLTVSEHCCLGWFKCCHLMVVGVASVGVSSCGHPSNRVGHCHKIISVGEMVGMSTLVS